MRSLAGYRLDDLFLPPDLRPVRLRGTFAPFFRASDNPIAMACLRLVTFLPLRPDLSVPFFRRRIALLTRLDAALPYFRPPEDFFRAIVILRLVYEGPCAGSAGASCAIKTLNQH